MQYFREASKSRGALKSFHRREEKVRHRERARRSGRTQLRQVQYHTRARCSKVFPSSSEREIRAKEDDARDRCTARGPPHRGLTDNPQVGGPMATKRGRGGRRRYVA